jgi:threonine dehydrogenase-like Zn-dependent dehydrogenase
MCIGSSNRPTGIILNDFIAGEFTIKGCYAYTRAEFNQCLDLIASGKYDPMRYVTKVASLDNIQETFDKLFKDPDNADVKVQIKMN